MSENERQSISSQFNVRVGLGNGTREQRLVITANNAKDAMRFAELQTGGKALGQSQVSTTKPKK
jgi:hypothetical protein